MSGVLYECEECGVGLSRMQVNRIGNHVYCDKCAAEHDDLNADDPRDFDGYEQ